MNEERLVEVSRYDSEMRATMAAARLESAGVPYLLAGHDASWMLPNLQLTMEGGFRLMVHTDDLARATELLEKLAADLASPGSLPPQPGKMAAGKHHNSHHDGSVWLIGAACLLLGLLIGYKYHGLRQVHNGEWTFDSNRDGRPDYWENLKDGVRLNSTTDTNFDGRPDVWSEFDDNLVTVSRVDVNFDGKPDRTENYQHGVIIEATDDLNHNGRPDVWEKYKDGKLMELRRDTDSDGVADVTELFRKGRPVEAHWRKKSSTNTWKKEFYQDGLLSVELVDTDDDGRFDTRRTYNALAEPIKTEQGIFD